MDTEQEKPARKHANYLAVFIALAVLTAIEIGVTQTSLPRVPILVPLAIIKASLVAMFYMHLRSDRKLFTMVFGMGVFVGLTMLIFFIVLFYTPLGGNSH
jgi:caa(3)-type oxidase subunit IV